VITPSCHPGREHHAHGLCGRCYLRTWRAERRTARAPHRGQRTVALVQRAERLKAELEAAGDYATVPATWPAIAQHLGMKPETLDRYRSRARQYIEREAA
jgi:hypothetical protein